MKKLNKTLAIGVLIAATSLGMTGAVNAALATVNLGAATNFAILAGAGITNVPTSVIHGDVGLSPAAGNNYAGLTQAEVTGSIYSTNAAGPGGAINNPAFLTTAKNDLTAAFTDATGRAPATPIVGTDKQLDGQTLVPGVYSFSGGAPTANLTGVLTLNGDGVYILQSSSDLVTGAGSSVILTGGAQACNVFWTTPSSAAGIGTNSTMVGTILAYSSINLGTGATLNGRLLAETAAVTLDHNTITAPTGCNGVPYPVTPGSGAASGVTPKFPNTGFSSIDSNPLLWAIGVTAGIIVISSLSALAIRKNRAA